jgi:hypothetical protein
LHSYWGLNCELAQALGVGGEILSFDSCKSVRMPIAARKRKGIREPVDVRHARTHAQTLWLHARSIGVRALKHVYRTVRVRTWLSVIAYTIRAIALYGCVRQSHSERSEWIFSDGSGLISEQNPLRSFKALFPNAPSVVKSIPAIHIRVRTLLRCCYHQVYTFVGFISCNCFLKKNKSSGRHAGSKQKNKKLIEGTV